MAKEVRKLYKSSTDKRIFGVCGGLAEYFNIDPTIVRIIFFALFMFRSTGFWLYIILGTILPYDFQVKPQTVRKKSVHVVKRSKMNKVKDVTPYEEDNWDDF